MSIKVRSKAKTAASLYGVRTVQPSLLKLTAELPGGVSVDKGYKSDVLVRVCQWQQSDSSSENEGSNPSASISHDRAVKYKLSEVTMAHVYLVVRIVLWGSTLIKPKYMDLLKEKVRVLLRILFQTITYLI